MADNKHYYYMRLKDDYFETEQLKLLEAMPDGYLYSNILLKISLLSLRGEGRLMFNNIMPYDAHMISILTGHQLGTVEKALEVFKRLELIDVLDNGAIYVMNIQNYIGKSSSEADRKREYERRIATEKRMIEEVNGEISGDFSEISAPETREQRLETREQRTDRHISSVSLSEIYRIRAQVISSPQATYKIGKKILNGDDVANKLRIMSDDTIRYVADSVKAKDINHICNIDAYIIAALFMAASEENPRVQMTKTKFNNFSTERVTNYAEIERELILRSMKETGGGDYNVSQSRPGKRNLDGQMSIH